MVVYYLVHNSFFVKYEVKCLNISKIAYSKKTIQCIILYVVDEDDSGDDEGDALTRNLIKRQAESLIDARTKRKMGGKRKKKKN